MRKGLRTGRAVKHSSHSGHHTRQTLRYKRFAKAASITTESRQPILTLALARPQRACMPGVWDAAKPFDLPANVTPVYSPSPRAHGKSRVNRGLWTEADQLPPGFSVR